MFLSINMCKCNVRYCGKDKLYNTDFMLVVINYNYTTTTVKYTVSQKNTFCVKAINQQIYKKNKFLRHT